MPEREPGRTESATPKRRGEARDKGSVPKSGELTKVVVLLAGLILLRLTMYITDREMTDIFRWFLGDGLRTQINFTTVNNLMLDICVRLAKMLLPLMILLAGTAYIVLRLQVGKLWVSKLFNPDFGKIFNPMAGLKSLLINPRAFIQLGRQVAQAAAIGLAPYLVLKSEFTNFMPLFYADIPYLAQYILGTAYTMMWYAMIPMLVIAGADIWYTRWDYEENLKMTKSEVKDELKNAEGDPEVKSKQRQKMFSIMSMRMLKKVPKADVVITNPTHLAIALQYDARVAPAPVVIAKGADHMAEKIKEIAREHHIPIRENKMLARALYKDVEIGAIIPEALFQAVAAILAQLNKFRSRRPS
jgi:flagellar biosynthesis protein FlhB